MTEAASTGGRRSLHRIVVSRVSPLSWAHGPGAGDCPDDEREAQAA